MSSMRLTSSWNPHRLGSPDRHAQLAAPANAARRLPFRSVLHRSSPVLRSKIISRQSAAAAGNATPATADETTWRSDGSGLAVRHTSPEHSSSEAQPSAADTDSVAEASSLQAAQVAYACPVRLASVILPELCIKPASQHADQRSLVLSSHRTHLLQHEVEVLQHTEAIQAELGGLGIGGEPVSLLSSIDGVHLDDIPVPDTAGPTTAHPGRPHIPCTGVLCRSSR